MTFKRLLRNLIYIDKVEISLEPIERLLGIFLEIIKLSNDELKIAPPLSLSYSVHISQSKGSWGNQSSSSAGKYSSNFHNSSLLSTNQTRASGLSLLQTMDGATSGKAYRYS